MPSLFRWLPVKLVTLHSRMILLHCKNGGNNIQRAYWVFLFLANFFDSIDCAREHTRFLSLSAAGSHEEDGGPNDRADWE
ncbi:hypothetical protein Nepgr_008754 [Nepenthes gracilis]|uniref:Uncharacterized protein n=1 Tax=Nepenthes gracilis TaxID=150966 RepID=A0AAD3XJK7_NEPGR|nr:hypothetical protein Nepgr_008754 [Nepenthes gracilis]